MTPYTHRNGETQPPELALTPPAGAQGKLNEFTYYWFDGVANYENWTGRGELIIVTGNGADRVVGLVVVAMMIDMKRPLKTADGHFIHNRATMIAIPETDGYDLAKCNGRWWGPVHVPKMSDDLMPSTAAVEDYEQWKRFQPEPPP